MASALCFTQRVRSVRRRCAAAKVRATSNEGREFGAAMFAVRGDDAEKDSAAAMDDGDDGEAERARAVCRFGCVPSPLRGVEGVRRVETLCADGALQIEIDGEVGDVAAGLDTVAQ